METLASSAASMREDSVRGSGALTPTAGIVGGEGSRVVAAIATPRLGEATAPRSAGKARVHGAGRSLDAMQASSWSTSSSGGVGGGSSRGAGSSQSSPSALTSAGVGNSASSRARNHGSSRYSGDGSSSGSSSSGSIATNPVRGEGRGHQVLARNALGRIAAASSTTSSESLARPTTADAGVVAIALVDAASADLRLPPQVHWPGLGFHIGLRPSNACAPTAATHAPCVPP